MGINNVPGTMVGTRDPRVKIWYLFLCFQDPVMNVVINNYEVVRALVGEGDLKEGQEYLPCTF